MSSLKMFPPNDHDLNRIRPFAAAFQMPVLIFKSELPLENNNFSKEITVDDSDYLLALETRKFPWQGYQELSRKSEENKSFKT